ncbi:hypothetical protein AX16_002291 [Volvariella volvacea WC 439]|nr:hypothetical protein AX16_002291 [Volvariella volvacea WC 439]
MEVLAERDEATVEFTFYGTCVAFVGETPALEHSQSFSVAIDDNVPYLASYGGYAAQLYRQWYQSPILPDGNHTVRFSAFSFMSIDYALVTAGESTPLQGDDVQVIVDDDDATYFIFTGDWARNLSIIDGTMGGLPFGNATHRARTVGDQLRFRFNGTSVGLYGVMLWNIPDPISVNYTLDGTLLEQASYGGVGGVPGPNERLHHELLQRGGFSPTEHELVMTIEGIGDNDRAFILDYAVYTPSFASIREMQAVESSTTSPAVSAETSGADRAGSDGTPVGAIIGGVIGGVMLIVVGFVAWWLIRSRGLNGQMGGHDDGHLSAPVPISEHQPPSGATFQGHPSHSGSAAHLLPGSHATQPHTGKSQLVLSPDTGLTVVPTPSARSHVRIQELENRFPVSNTDSSSAGGESCLQSTLRLGPAALTGRDYEAEIRDLRQRIEVLRCDAEDADASPPDYDDRDRDQIPRAGSVSVGHANASTRPAQ